VICVPSPESFEAEGANRESRVRLSWRSGKTAPDFQPGEFDHRIPDLIEIGRITVSIFDLPHLVALDQCHLAFSIGDGHAGHGVHRQVGE
jgi:hypothetical protein